MSRLFSSTWKQRLPLAILFGSSVLLGGIASLFIFMSAMEHGLEQSLSRLLEDSTRVMAHQLETELTSLTEYFEQLSFKEVHIQTPPFEPIGAFIAESWVLGVQFFEKNVDEEEAQPQLRHTSTNTESFLPQGLKENLGQMFKEGASVLEKAFLGESGLSVLQSPALLPPGDQLGLYVFPLKSPGKNYAGLALIRLSRFKALMEQALHMEGAFVDEKGQVLLAAEPFKADPAAETFSRLLQDRFQHLVPESTIVRQHILEDQSRVWIASARIRESTIYGTLILRRSVVFQEWLSFSGKVPILASILFLMGCVFGLMIPVGGTRRSEPLTAPRSWVPEIAQSPPAEAQVIDKELPKISQPLPASSQNQEKEEPVLWYVQTGNETLGPAEAHTFAKALFMQELSFEDLSWRVSGGDPVSIANSGMFEGSSEKEASWWVFDGHTVHGPLTEAFIRTAFLHGSLSDAAWLCRGSNLEGWISAKAWLEVFSQPQTEA